MADMVQPSIPMLGLNTDNTAVTATHGLNVDDTISVLTTILGSNLDQSNSSLPNQTVSALIHLLQLLSQQMEGGEQLGTKRGGRNDSTSPANRDYDHKTTGTINRNSSPKNSPLAGVYNKITTKTPEVKSAANFAATELGGTLKSVNNASQQIVAGMNDNMDIQLTDGQTYNVTVYKALNSNYSLRNASTVFT